MFGGLLMVCVSFAEKWLGQNGSGSKKEEGYEGLLEKGGRTFPMVTSFLSRILAKLLQRI